MKNLGDLKEHASTLTHALRVAADRFDEDAKVMLEQVPAYHPLATQFTRQASECRELAEEIEEAQNEN
jgi:hypothetical protein